MSKMPGKLVFQHFEPNDAGPPGRDVIGTAQVAPTEEQVRALEALRVWDSMAEGAYPPNTVRAWRAENAKQFQEALADARRYAGPGLIVVATDPDHMGPRCGVCWDAEPAECSRRSAVNGARKAYESDRKKRQRWRGESGN